jgi:hypothetical protein
MASFVKVGTTYVNVDRVAVIWDRPNENMTTLIFHWIADPGKTSHVRAATIDFTDPDERKVLVHLAESLKTPGA